MGAAKATIDHDTIREWAEKRGGHPACVRGTGRDEDPGILRIDFPGFSGEGKLKEISWETFFEWFDANELAFLYQDEKDSRFNKLVSREREDLRVEDGSSKGKQSKQASNGGRPKRKESRPNAIRLLEQQHREVEAVFDSFNSTEDPEEKYELAMRVADLLAAHAKIEETIFYPAMYGEETEDELREAVEEHLAVKRVIADLLKLKADHPQLAAKMRVLEEAVAHHVEEEENRLFEIVSNVDDEVMLDLGKDMRATFDKLMKSSPRKAVPRETSAPASLE